MEYLPARGAERKERGRAEGGRFGSPREEEGLRRHHVKKHLKPKNQINNNMHVSWVHGYEEARLA